MRLLPTILLISTPALSISHSIDVPVPAIAKVSEAACIRSYSVKEHIACIKLVDSSILKAYWVGKMSKFCKSKLNKPAEKNKQCNNILMLADALDDIGSRYLEE
ncbi:hypothetical protein [Yersinia pekkanenii]|uniref:Uncharacterized protein n=1 Tax=Yersinia pekkanenii TaxID=1288385 RepID=A0A0T9PWX4_9GAMM|nr:hypothetical protein [Yersinia pekkanenii]CNH85833.1 Uncharacterised protein [Yersinia pekkanenii]CRY63560.1 Uncharacterised protein [Yersinia pekkanenii]